MPLPDWLKQEQPSPPPEAPTPPEAAEPEVVEAAPVAEPVAAEPEPEPAPEPGPVAAETEPEPVAADPAPVVAEPDPAPVAAAPEPVVAEPEPAPAAADPEPEAVEPTPEPPATAVETPDAPEEAPESSDPTVEVLDVLAKIEKQLGRLGDFHIVEGSTDVAPAAEDVPDDRPTLVDLEEREAELHLMRKRVTELETQTAQASVEQSEQSVAMTKQLGEAQKEIKTLAKSLKEVNAAKATESDARIDAMSEQITILQAAVKTAEQATREAHESLEALEQASQAPEPTPEPAPEAAVEPAGASQDLVERQRVQIERLTEKLVSLQSNVEPEEIQERDDRIAELEEQVNRMGGQGGKVGKLVAGFSDALSKVRSKGARKADDGGASSALEFRLQEVTGECEQLRDALKAARQEGHDLRLEIEKPTTGAVSDATPDQHAAQIASLRARVTQLEDELNAVSDGDETGHTTVLQQRISRLEQELAAARVGDKQGELHAQQAKELREQWKQLREQRAALDHAPPPGPVGSRRQRALIVVTCLVVLVAVGAVFSGLAAHRFLPATVMASVDIEAQGRRGGGVEGKAATAWETWHRETLADPSFRGKVAARLADQRLDHLANARVLGERLDHDLSIYAIKPGALRLSFAGTDPDTLAAVLDTVAVTLAQESARAVTSRSDGAIAVILGEHNESGRVRYATLNATPVKDHRLIAACFFFVTAMVIVLCLGRWVYGVLARTKSEMVDNDFESVAAEV